MVDIEYKPRKEVNKINKKGRPRDAKVGILMPLPYKAALSSLSMHLFYEYINSLEDAIAYRFVYNLDEDVVESLDGNVNLRHLDVILISASFELDYLNIARILHSFKLLPIQKGMLKPIVIVGGLAPTSNPLPLSSITDAAVVGEAEELITDIIYAAKDENPWKLLEGIKCLFLSHSKHKVKKCVISDLDNVYHPILQVSSIEEEPIFGYGIRIEMSRGCPYLCPFCMEAHVFYPFRYRSYSKVHDIIDKGLNLNTIARRVILYSLSFFSIPYADKLLDELFAENIVVSIPSLRVEHITEKRLEVMHELGQKTLTVAPETLVKDSYCRIGKCIDVESMANNILYAYKLGYEHVKIYLITGFPHIDIDEELEALTKFLNIVSNSVKKYSFIEITLNLLIPKPWTPYQYLPPNYVLENSPRIKKYLELLKKYKIVHLDAMNPRWGLVQAIIAQGDDNLSNMMVECAIGRCTPTTFLKLVNMNIDRYRYIYSGWGYDPPWMKVVDIGFNTRYLEYRFKYLTKFDK